MGREGTSYPEIAPILYTKRLCTTYLYVHRRTLIVTWRCRCCSNETEREAIPSSPPGVERQIAVLLLHVEYSVRPCKDVTTKE